MTVKALDPDFVRSALLNYAEVEWDYRSFSSYINEFGDLRGKTFEIPELGKVTIVDYHDYDVNKNYDGWSEDIWVVFQIHGVLYKAFGKHSSYEGSVWEHEMKLVAPKIRHVIDYEEIQ